MRKKTKQVKKQPSINLKTTLKAKERQLEKLEAQIDKLENKSYKLKEEIKTLKQNNCDHPSTYFEELRYSYFTTEEICRKCGATLRRFYE